MAQSQRDTSPGPNPVSRPVESSPPWGALVVAVGSALAAGVTGHLVPGSPGLVAAGVLAVLAGAVTLLFVKGPGASHATSQPQGGADALRGVDAMISGLERLSQDLAKPVEVVPTAAGTGKAGRTPAQLVDDVVHTAADGIEDLAAGLMRANELASVAERVTNRATLLALNAALEATRSGSEAFASIAEEK